MNKQTTKARVPTLRFPEFRDSGEWKVEELDGKTITDHFADVGKKVERRLASAVKSALKKPDTLEGE
jgi:hypothetical protein